MSKRFPLRPRSIGLALLSSLGVMAMGLTELRPAAAEFVCPKNSWVYQGQLSLARDDLKNAKVQRNRMQMLQAAGAISQSELDRAETDYQIRLLQVEALLQNSSTSASPSTRSAQLAAAEAEVELAQNQLNRYRFLFQQGAISRQETQLVEQQYQQAVKRRDDLRKPGAEVQKPQSPGECNQPNPLPADVPQQQELRRTGL